MLARPKFVCFHVFMPIAGVVGPTFILCLMGDIVRYSSTLEIESEVGLSI